MTVSLVRTGFLLGVWVVGLLVIARPALSQGYSPEVAAEKMTVAAGLEVKLVASEPLVRQPVAIDFDDQGRLWVAQYLQYPNPAGLKRVAVDRYSRTKYDRLPEPPPLGPKGEDRITILEDTDGDGVMDRGKDFISGLNLASGFAFGDGGVYVLQAPYLLFYPDKNRDDIPDRDPEVLLCGFGMEDAHSVANSLTWGPDGWLYGLQGSTVTAHIDGIEFQQGVWRYHRRTRRFELFFEGGGNMWGLDFDLNGNVIASTNFGPHIAMHATSGGYGWKSFGKHGALHNPYSYGYFDHCKHEGPPAGHVTVGGLFYDALAFPERFRGKYIAGDLLRHCVRAHDFIPDGSTFRTRHFDDVLWANDASFATSDLTLGPDGCVYVADWNDKRTAHPDPDADWDRSNGRIYAIRPAAKNAKNASKFVGDLQKRSANDLFHLLSHPNVWYRRRARRIIAEKNLVELKDRIVRRARASGDIDYFWTIAHAGWLDCSIAREFLLHGSEQQRAWAVQLTGDNQQLTGELSDLLVGSARDTSLAVRSRLAATLKRLNRLTDPQFHRIVAVLGRDANDPRTPLHLWWALNERAGRFGSALCAYATSPASYGPLGEFMLPRVVQRLAAFPDNELGELQCLLRIRKPNESVTKLLPSVELAWRGRGRVQSGGLRDVLIEYAKHKPGDRAALRLLARLGDESSLRALLKSLTDAKTSTSDKVATLELARELAQPTWRKPLLDLAQHDTSVVVRSAALDALAGFGDPKIATELLAQYAMHSDPWQATARRVLMSRPQWAKSFLREVDASKIDPATIPIDEVRGLAHFKDVEIDQAVREHWGHLKAGIPEEKLAEVRRLNNDLSAGRGRREPGRKLFLKHCAGCHRLHGEGEMIGPELTNANRGDRQFLLISLVDPGAVVRKEYQTSLIALRDGRVISGLIGEQSAHELTVIESSTQKTTVKRSEIEEIKESDTSLMPEDLYKLLSAEDLRDLFCYLQADVSR